MTNRDRASFLAFNVVTLGVLIWFYWPYLTHQLDYYWSDHSLFFEPLLRFIAGRLSEHAFPLWNPLIGCGQSQLAIVSPGLFYPATIVMAAMPYTFAVAVAMVAHQWIASVGGYLLVSRLRWGPLAACICGWTVGLNGYMFGLSSNFTLPFTAAWVPVFAWGLLVASQPRSSRELSGALLTVSFASALMLLAGRPEIWAVALVALVVYWAILFVANSSASNVQSRRPLVLAACAAVCGMLIAAPSILPAAEWSRLSPRTIQAITNPAAWSSTWYDLYTQIFGTQLGNISDAHNEFSAFLTPEDGSISFLPTAYFGAIALNLSLIALFDGRWRQRFKWLALFVLVVCVALGSNFFLFGYLVKIFPAAALLRYPTKLQYFLDVIIAICAARGIYFSQSEKRAVRLPALVMGALWTSIALCGLYMVLNTEAPLFGLHKFLSAGLGANANQAIRLLGAGIAWWSLASILICLALFVITFKASNRWRPALSIAIVLAQLFSLLFVSWQSIPDGTVPGFYSKPSYSADVIHSQYRAALPPRVVALFPAHKLGIPAGYHLPGHSFGYADMMLLNRQSLQDNAPLDFRISNTFSYEGSETRPNRVLELYTLDNVSQANPKSSDTIAARICQMSGTEYATTEIQPDNASKLPILDKRFFQLISEQPALNMRVYKVLGGLPFAYFISKWIDVQSDRRALGLILDCQRNQWNPQALCLAAQGFEPAQIPKAASTDADPTLLVPIQAQRFEPEHIQLHVKAPADGLVVVNDNIYPGWKANVDGHPTPILRANAAFKAVFVPAGSHEIEFRFAPQTLYYGLLGSVFGLLGTIALYFCSLNRVVRTAETAES